MLDGGAAIRVGGFGWTGKLACRNVDVLVAVTRFPAGIVLSGDAAGTLKLVGLYEYGFDALAGCPPAGRQPF